MKYSDHKDSAKNCTRCGLCERRKKVVVARGSIPCDILFIGEAPGEGEDVIGKPFVGPAGKLLDHIIEQAIPKEYKVSFTNLVCCIPLDEDREKREPTKEEIFACRDRLVEFVEELAKPKVIVLVGVLSKKYVSGLKFKNDIPWVAVTHPAFILRANIAQRGLEIQRCISKLRDLFDDDEGEEA